MREVGSIGEPDFVLIAEEDLNDPSRDCYIEWLETYGVRRDDERLAALRVHLRPLSGQDRFQRLYYLPRDVWRGMMGKQEDWLNVAAVARWVQMVVTPWTTEFRDAVDSGDRLEQVRIWNRVEGLRRLVDSLCGPDDLAWLDRSLFEQGVPLHQPTLWMSEHKVIDLRNDEPARTFRPPPGGSAPVETVSAKPQRKRRFFG